MSVLAAIGIGSNEGDRAGTILRALRMLDASAGSRVERASSLYETAPVGGPPQGRYLNAAALVRTTMGARQFLDQLLRIEATLGRHRIAGERAAPRSIDLDILLFGDAILREEGLEIPHPRMAERAFALVPLAEIAPEAIHPALRMPVHLLLRRLGRIDPVPVWGPPPDLANQTPQDPTCDSRCSQAPSRRSP